MVLNVKKKLKHLEKLNQSDFDRFWGGCMLYFAIQGFYQRDWLIQYRVDFYKGLYLAMFVFILNLNLQAVGMHFLKPKTV